MNKTADLSQLLGGAKDRLSDAGGALRTWFSQLNPEIRDTVLRGLAGAAIGGATTGGIAAMTPGDREDRKGVLGPAMLGALLGGGAAAGIPLGMKMLGSGVRFHGESHRPVGARTVEALGEPIVNNPFTIGLPAFAGWHARHSIGTLAHGMRGDALAAGAAGAQAPALSRFIETLNNKPFWNTPRDIYHNVLPRGAEGIRNSRMRLAGIPLALVAGVLADKYMKGEY